MKKLVTVARVYDTTTMEYVQKTCSYPISDALAEAIARELDFGNKHIKTEGHGANDSKERLPYKTPLASQKRFYIDPQFHVADEEGNYLCGWQGC